MATICPPGTIDSNSTGLRIAEEVCLKVLPSVANGDPMDPVWHAQEPNSYSDFGGDVSTVARNPINPSRQRKKGTVTDLDASGGYNSDLTQANLTRTMQGILFADIREKPTTAPMNGVATVMTGVTNANYTAAAGLGKFKAGDLIKASGFGVAANNGLKLVTAAAAGTVAVAGLAAEAAPPAGAKLELVGRQFAAGDLSVVMSGNVAQLVTTAEDFTTMQLIPGEWLYVGGDIAANQFANNLPGFARIGRVTAKMLELDKVDWVPAVSDGAAKTVRLFFGSVIQTEGDPDLIKRRTYQLERSLGKDNNNQTMSEYLIGAVPNEFTLNVAQADKVTWDITYIACEHQQRNGAQGLKGGVRPQLNVSDDAFNTSSDFSRIKMSLVDETASNPVPLFADVTDLTITVNNNVSPVKAIGTLGAIDLNAGTIEVGGSQTAYFTGVEAVQAIRNNSSVTIDVIMVKANAGVVFDLPLVTLGNGRLNVEQDQKVTLPLDTMGAQSKFGTSMLYESFPYLPTAADL